MCASNLNNKLAFACNRMLGFVLYTIAYTLYVKLIISIRIVDQEARRKLKVPSKLNQIRLFYAKQTMKTILFMMNLYIYIFLL